MSEFVSWDDFTFPTEWKKHVPNHQPVIAIPNFNSSIRQLAA